jgi:hypothetical protein
VEVADARDLHVLDGAQVFWRELRRFSVIKKNNNKLELVICAEVVGLKHCRYIMGGKNMIATLERLDHGSGTSIIARPINKKLPGLQIVNWEEQ